MKVTMEQLTEIAKADGKTMHGYMKDNKDTVFDVSYWEGSLVITYNDLPGGYIKYALNPTPMDLVKLRKGLR